MNWTKGLNQPIFFGLLIKLLLNNLNKLKGGDKNDRKKADLWMRVYGIKKGG